MDKTGLLEIKKRFKYPDVSFSSMAYAFNPSGEDEDDKGNAFTGESKFLTRDDDEQKALTGMIAKAFSFGAGVSSMDVPVEGDMRKLLEDYSRKDDHKAFGLKELVEQITKNYPELNAYSIVIFRDNYDIPIKDEAKTKTGESEEVYQYLALMICPVKPMPVGLSPDEQNKNIVRSGVMKQLQPPVFGLIYPSFKDRSADCDHAFVCCKSDNERSLCESLFGSKMDAPAKKEKAAVKKEEKSDNKPAPTKAVSEDKPENIKLEEGYFEETPKSGIGSIHLSDVADHNEEESEYRDAGLNDIDNALNTKRTEYEDAYEDDGDDAPQTQVKIKEDKSKAVLNRVTERDIDGKKYFLIPKDILPQDILEQILAL